MPPVDFLAHLYPACDIEHCPSSAQDICPHWPTSVLFQKPIYSCERKAGTEQPIEERIQHAHAYEQAEIATNICVFLSQRKEENVHVRVRPDSKLCSAYTPPAAPPIISHSASICTVHAGRPAASSSLREKGSAPLIKPQVQFYLFLSKFPIISLFWFHV